MEFKIMPTNEIYEKLLDYSNTENPFWRIDKLRNSFKYFSLEESYGQKNYFFTIWNTNDLIGYLKLKTEGSESLYFPTFFNWMCSIEILHEYRGNGLAKQLIEFCFIFLKEQNLEHLLQSGYSADGFKLRSFFWEMAKKYKIRFIDKDKIEF